MFYNLKSVCNTTGNARVTRRKFYSIKSKIKKNIIHYIIHSFLGFFPVCTHIPKHIKVFFKLLLVGQLSGCERPSQKRS